MKTVWQFFSSVQLAIATLCLLAFTAVFGTIIPQGKSFEWYIQYFSDFTFAGKEVGENVGYRLALMADILDITDMYSSWWFTALLLILSLNLLVCSIDRIPITLKLVRSDNLKFPIERLKKMKLQHTFDTIEGDSLAISNAVQDALVHSGWKPLISNDLSPLIFAQKGRISHFGVYIVHISILVIFAGALVGSLLGYKGSVILPETRSTSVIYDKHDSSPIDLGFTVICESFDMEYYDNGTPKEYTSLLTIVENDQEVLQQAIEVNKPLTYRGVTFYQASYEPYQDFVITISASKTNLQTTDIAPFQKMMNWQEENVRYGIINAESMRNELSKVKLWLTKGDAEPVSLWIEPKTLTPVLIGDEEYTVSVKQMFATGLQVAKDPGVPLVYLGCAMILLGLYMAFFMSHRRIWVSIAEADKTSTVSVFATTNKNLLGFTPVFEKIISQIQQSLQEENKLNGASHHG